MGLMIRIHARIPMSVKDMIDFVASLEGRTGADFLIIAAASERARRVITEHQLVQLTLLDQKLLANALADNAIRERDDFPAGLAREYRKRVKSE